MAITKEELDEKFDNMIYQLGKMRAELLEITPLAHKAVLLIAPIDYLSSQIIQIKGSII